MDWKEDIGTFLADNDMFRIKYLNDNLAVYCKEYVQYLNEFNGIIANEHRNPLGNDIWAVDIVVELSMYRLAPFKLFCHFDEDGNLCLKYSVNYNYKAVIKNAISPEPEEKKDHHIYKEESIADSEKVEKEYVLQLFTNRLKQYIEVLKAKNT